MNGERIALGSLLTFPGSSVLMEEAGIIITSLYGAYFCECILTATLLAPDLPLLEPKIISLLFYLVSGLICFPF